jgi:hypothetical protein
MDVSGTPIHAAVLLSKVIWRCSSGLVLMDVIGTVKHVAMRLKEVIWRYYNGLT